MKIKTLISQLIFISTIFVGQLYGQFFCTNENSGESTPPDDYTTPYSSMNGYFLPVEGTIRVLVIFAEVDYDIGTDPDDEPDNWDAGELPTWADDLFDPNVSSGQMNGSITKYYYEASFGNLNIIGDYLYAPNDGIFSVLKSEIGTTSGLSALSDVIDSEMNGNFITANDLNSITNFDTWTLTVRGKPKVTPSIDNPNLIDHVMVIWRNSTYKNNNTGFTNPGYPGDVLGYDGDTYSYIITKSANPTNIIRHEFAHNLVGDNYYHAAGGEVIQTTSFHELEDGASLD